jgi:hypothetical protein
MAIEESMRFVELFSSMQASPRRCIWTRADRLDAALRGGIKGVGERNDPSTNVVR